MQIVATRVDVHRYSTITERNGVQLRVPGYGFMRALHHDLAHFVVEGSLGLDQGFWGSVADGAEFAGMEKIKGRRQIGATRPFALEGGEQSGPRPRRNARAPSNAELRGSPHRSRDPALAHTLAQRPTSSTLRASDPVPMMSYSARGISSAISS